MTVSIAEINSRVYAGLTPVADFITDLSAVHNSVVQALNVRTSETRLSDVNVLLAKTSEFTPNVTPYDITALIGKGVPCWIETRTITSDIGVDRWQQIRVVNRSQLNDYQSFGWSAAAGACAFWGEDPDTNTTAQPVQYVAFSYLPGAVCRIWYDRDSQRLSDQADILLPDNLSELIVREAMNDIIPGVKLQIVMRMRRDSELRGIAPMLIQTLDAQIVQNLVVIRDLDAIWRRWAFQSRDNETSFNMRTPSGSRLYGGRNNGWWGR